MGLFAQGDCFINSLGGVAGERVVELGYEGVAVGVGERHERSPHDNVFNLTLELLGKTEK